MPQVKITIADDNKDSCFIKQLFEKLAPGQKVDPSGDENKLHYNFYQIVWHGQKFSGTISPDMITIDKSLPATIKKSLYL